MDNSIYTLVARQSGLNKELKSIAHNIANANTVGFKREAVVFTEHVKALEGGTPSLSMGRLGAHFSDFLPGTLRQTNGPMDVAIDGDGFFLIETAGGPRLSRAGHFLTNVDGTLVNPDGLPVLDEAGGQLTIPPGVTNLAIAGDGTISSEGEPLGKIGVVTADQTDMDRIGDNLWHAKNGYQVVEDPRVVQGFLEDSNVQPVEEIARLIEVQRHYELGQRLLDDEDDRISQTIATLRRNR